MKSSCVNPSYQEVYVRPCIQMLHRNCLCTAVVPKHSLFSYVCPYFMHLFLEQVIETVSAVDKDEMTNRQHFTYALAPEAAHNQNFSLKDNRGKIQKYFFIFVFNSWYSLSAAFTVI